MFAMTFAIEKINNDSKLLPNISLGYDIRNYCEIAMQATRISMGQCFHDFVRRMQSSYTPYVIDAVYSMAHALKILIENTTAKDVDYKLKRNMDINVMKSLLSRVSFAGMTGNVSFDKFGDRRSVLYDIVNFQQVEENHTKRLEQVAVGKWKEPNGYIFPKTFNGSLQLTNLHSLNVWTNALMGQEKPPLHPSLLLELCRMLPWHSQPDSWLGDLHGLEGKSPMRLANIKYSNAGGIVILVFTVAGLVTTLFSFTVTCRFWNSPIVKASNRKFSIVLVISILLLLTLAVINLLKRSDTTCKITYQSLITYNLCLSFLLVKILRISSAFQTH